MPPAAIRTTNDSTPATKNWPHNAKKRSLIDCLTDRFHAAWRTAATSARIVAVNIAA